MTNDGRRFSIGDLSRLCNVSKKALRLYDEMGLISSVRDVGNNYRFYTHDELLMVLVLKYYKQMGFRLEEMKEFITGRSSNVLGELDASFGRKAGELRKARDELLRCEKCVRDWHGLVQEAELVSTANAREVCVKYVPPCRLLCMDQEFDGDMRSAIINIGFMSHVEQTGNSVTGPVFIRFHSRLDRMEGRAQSMRVMQEALPAEGAGGEQEMFGGCMMAACYHIGPLAGICETYARLGDWVRRHGYVAEEGCCERYVSDYWTTNNEKFHVTELLVKVSRN